MRELRKIDFFLADLTVRPFACNFKSLPLSHLQNLASKSLELGLEGFPFNLNYSRNS